MEPFDTTFRALLLLARVPLGSRCEEARALLEQGVDFDRLCELAFRGGLAGAVAASLEEVGLSLVPRRALRALVASRLKTETDGRRLLAEARRLVLAARARDLTIVPVKGISLLMDRPYRDLGLRTLVDIDFLIPPDRYAVAEQLLLDEGYEAEARREHALRHEHHVRFFGAAPDGVPLMVELHWTPFYTLYGGGQQDDAVFERLVPHRYDGVTFELLDLQDTLLVLLTHLAHHRFRGQLKWALDVALLVDELGDRIDWSAFWARGRHLGAARGLAYGLWLVRGLFGSVPDEAVGSYQLPPVVHSALHRLNPPRELLEGVVGQPPVWQRTITDFLLQDRLIDGARYLLYKIPELLERETRTAVRDGLVRGGPGVRR